MEPASFETWARGNSVARLDLNVTVGGDPTSFAVEFTKQYHELWNISAFESSLEVLPVESDSTCTYVTLQQKLDGVPIYGATLRYSFSGNTLVHVVGRLDGRPFDVLPANLTKSQSLAVLASELGTGNEVPDASSFELSVVDPYFIDDSAHAARIGYSLEGAAATMAGSVAVVDATGVGSANGTAAGAIVLPNDGRCEVVGVSIRELWFDTHPLHVGPLSLNLAVEHDSHAYSVTPLAGPTQSLFTRVAWRQNMGARCSFQVAWELRERDDANCLTLINSLQGADNSTPPSPVAAGDCGGAECN